VAGSGKTTSIVEGIDAAKRYLIFTYTDENLHNLRRKVIQRLGHVPANVALMTYFSFLHSFCFRPAMGLRMPTAGLNFAGPPLDERRFNQTQDRFYLDGGRRLYYNRLAKLVLSRGMDRDARERIEKYFDVICVDEVQDFAGNDFNFLVSLCDANVSMLLVGDYFQHTYDTSRDGSVNANLHANFRTYVKRFTDAGVEVDTTSLAKSRRCSPAVCLFIRESLGVDINSHSDRAAQVVLVKNQADADALHARDDVVKLFYQKHAKYGCTSQNWGASKGEDHYDEVCVVLNETTLSHYKKNDLRGLPPGTRNKLYVAFSRSRGNLYLVPHKMFEQYKRG